MHDHQAPLGQFPSPSPAFLFFRSSGLAHLFLMVAAVVHYMVALRHGVG